ncbi:hypothetical protein BAUCODRAFT_464804 [Baudoinia panamericana UAMH 10762]|uniref:Uncharacterized protein n=1 Tax=Baudoinia panamericana (strain UAMH 10762) TaxID=717646 RepID=M2MHQ5_BAUPA|nr:uncharacterized protein BAUCODRAFT_464804 [Baudoinia panamericana UAMH 10762]EMC96146.1 hypothetical protein BAUCODRAFT_464804 [Baudoinia panamericana UAMH 10762]
MRIESRAACGQFCPSDTGISLHRQPPQSRRAQAKMDSLIGHASDQALKFGAKALDKWTKGRDSRKQQEVTTSMHIPDGEHPLSAQGPTIIAENIGVGTTTYASDKYQHLQYLPMFVLESEDEDLRSREKILKSAEGSRGQIREVQMTPVERAVLTLSGGGSVMSAVKLENGLLRLNAQTTEMHADQVNRCVLTRWTIPATDASRNGLVIVDVLEVRMNVFTTFKQLNGAAIYVKANADVHLKLDDRYEIKCKRQKCWYKGTMQPEPVKQIFLLGKDRSAMQMEIVAMHGRLVSVVEHQGRSGRGGLAGRFRDWSVPDL